MTLGWLKYCLRRGQGEEAPPLTLLRTQHSQRLGRHRTVHPDRTLQTVLAKSNSAEQRRVQIEFSSLIFQNHNAFPCGSQGTRFMCVMLMCTMISCHRLAALLRFEMVYITNAEDLIRNLS